MTGQHFALTFFTFFTFLPASAYAAGVRAGVNLRCLEKAVAGDAPKPDALITLGILDQVQGDLESARKKYEKAIDAGAKDLGATKLDLTFVKEAIWIQSDACRIAVPRDYGDAKPGAKVPDPKDPAYPANVEGAGTATVTVAINPAGKAARIHVTESTDDSDNDVAKLVARVQFALAAIDAARAKRFPDGNAGKSFTWTAHFSAPPE